MLGSVSKIVNDVSTLRRMLFAAANLPPQIPNYWGVILDFATQGKTKSSDLTQEQVRVLMENLKLLDKEAFHSDEQLLKELHQFPSKPLGVLLLSDRESCVLCGSKLLIRTDKSSSVTIYDDALGTLPATHFHKYCSRRLCTCTQFYGYYTSSDSLIYNEDCTKLNYFMSTRETAITTSLLKRLDAEIVIGQLSYKQRAEIYNTVHYSTWCEVHSADRYKLLAINKVWQSSTSPLMHVK